MQCNIAIAILKKIKSDNTKTISNFGGTNNIFADFIDSIFLFQRTSRTARKAGKLASILITIGESFLKL